MEEKSRLRIPFKAILVGAVILVAVFMLFSFAGQFFYFFERVDQDEVGVQFESGRIKGVVGPGVYTDAGLFVNMQRVSSAAVDFIVTDEELITQDKQRIGLVVTGDVFRPGLAQGDRSRDCGPSTINSISTIRLCVAASVSAPSRP